MFETLKVKNNLVKYKYSEKSLKKFIGVHPLLVDFAFELANVIDCTIVFGVRSYEEQNALYRLGKSSKDGFHKKSKHQKKTDSYGHALDILPLPRGVNMYLDDGTEDNIRWAQFDGLCHGIAYKLGIKVRTGFKWRDNMMDSLKRTERSNTFPDGNHVEIVL